MTKEILPVKFYWSSRLEAYVVACPGCGRATILKEAKNKAILSNCGVCGTTVFWMNRYKNTLHNLLENAEVLNDDETN